MRIAARGVLLWGLLLGGCTNSFGDKAGGGSSVAAPGGLACVLAAGRLSLTWTDNSGNETGFRLEVNAGPFGTPPYTDVIFLPANATSTTTAGPPNTTLHFRIFAITANSQSDPSNEITFLTPNVPNRPGNFTALTISDNQVDLQWQDPGNTTGFRLERFDANTSLFSVITTVGAGTTSYVDTLPYFIPAQLPLHRITAVNGNGDSVSDTAKGMTFWRPQSTTTATTPPTAGPYDYGMWSSVAVGAAGDLFVSYYDAMDTDLWFNHYRSSVGWFNSKADNGGGGLNYTVGFDGTSLALDSLGNVHIAANRYGFVNDLRYVTNAGGSWAATTVDPTGGQHPQLKISPVNGSLHMVYHQGTTMNYATKVGSGAWTISTIPISIVAGSVPSLAIDPAGGVHIVLSADFSFTLYHWSPTLGFDLITPTAGTYDHTALAIDGSGTLHVSYNDGSTGMLMYATNAGGAWSSQAAHFHTRGNLGRHNSIVADGAGNIFISYYDAVWGNLWQARKPAGSAAFVQMLVAWGGDIGRYTSSALDPANVVTSCYDVSAKNLKVFWVAR
jgi:hypothetical protein